MINIKIVTITDREANIKRGTASLWRVKLTRQQKRGKNKIIWQETNANKTE
jgi:hypothetical protein